MTDKCLGLICSALAFALTCADCAAAAKFIGYGWDLAEAAPESLVATASALGCTGLDGVMVCVPKTRQADGSVISSASLPQDAPWRYESLAGCEAKFRKFLVSTSLRESFLETSWHFTPGRIALEDDAGWTRFAGNMRMLARLARRSGFRGIVVDAEDYTKVRQFHTVAGDPEYGKASEIARRRGREVFKGVFEEFPDVTVLSFWLFTRCAGACASQDPASWVRQEGDLWPHFLNGVLDVMPAMATLVDGDEAAYKYDSRADFDRGALRQVQKAAALVDPLNLEKFRARTRIGFGQYVDMYVNEPGKSGSWFFGPAGGSRLEHLRRNLEFAADVGDYVWIYGEKRSWADWKDPKGYRRIRGYSRHNTWEQALPGFAEVISELRDPQDAARRTADRMRRGGANNLYAANVHRRWAAPKESLPAFAVSGDEKSCIEVSGIAAGALHVPVDGAKEGDIYVVDMWQKGEPGGVAEVIWRTGGPFNWKLGRHAITAGEADERGRRRAVRILHVPKGADGLMFRINVRQNGGERAVFEDVAIYKSGRLGVSSAEF